MKSVRLFEEGYLSEPKDKYVIEIRKPLPGIQDDGFYRHLLQQLNSLRMVALEHNVWMEAYVEEEYMSIEEFCAYIHVSIQTGYKIARKGFPFVSRIGKKYLFHKAMLDEYIKVNGGLLNE